MQIFMRSPLLIEKLRRWNNFNLVKNRRNWKRNLLNGSGTCPDVGFSIQDTFGPFQFGAMVPTVLINFNLFSGFLHKMISKKLFIIKHKNN